MGSCQKENWWKSCFNEMGYIIPLWYSESTGYFSYSCLVLPLLWDQVLLIQPLHNPHSVGTCICIVGAGGIDEIVNAPTSIDLPWDELIISSHYNSHRRTITIRPVHPPTTRVVRQYRLPRSYSNWCFKWCFCCFLGPFFHSVQLLIWYLFIFIEVHFTLRRSIFLVTKYPFLSLHSWLWICVMLSSQSPF